MSSPIVNVGVVSNVFVRQMHFENINDVEIGHTHSFDHLTLLAKGKLRIIANGAATEYIAPAMIFIKADIQHELVALSENTVAYCVHALRDKNVSEDIISPDMIPNGSYVKELISQITIK